MSTLNDYLPAEIYLENLSETDEDGFVRFQDETTALFYFALFKGDSQLIFRSEGYKTEKSRENGVKSVLKNFENDKRYKIIEEEGHYFLVLKAGNHIEIARSVAYASEEEVDHLLGCVLGDDYTPLEEETEETESEDFESHNGDFLSGFMDDQQYLGRQRIHDFYGPTGYVKFHHPNGQFYYAVYNPDDSLYLKSIAFEEEGERDSFFDRLNALIENEDYYDVEKFDGKYYAVITDDNDFVLGLSAGFDTFIDAFKITPTGRQKEITDGIF
ncbi:YegP family protein [Marinilongibacter aquaticus]|uniref:YegP family protein n=1 Tax=Marinilongibacter aquaticus TaxID=2975157 RepID=UPI0021BDA09A|nr:YegP family protein [Marinilongibacter aquaticus]UBM58090.1 YegP family protein [Marinilongibacter aquaticus]